MKLYAKIVPFKGIRRTGRFEVFIACCLFVFSLSAQALDKKQAKDILASIFQMRVHAFLAINAYYNYSANKGDESLQAEIEDSSKDIDAVVKGLKDNQNKETEDDIKQIDIDWSKYRKLIKTNVSDIIRQGYPDLRMVDNMAKQNLQFNKTMDKTSVDVANSSGFAPSEATLKMRAAALDMAQMMTRYSARSTSSVSQVFQGAEDQKPIDKLAEDFDTSLKNLKKYQTDNQKIKNLLDNIDTQWEFIRGSYINYDKKNVNYIANLYSKKIISDLVELSKITNK
jgi:uncharacterized protein YjaG (DUF416 family)